MDDATYPDMIRDLIQWGIVSLIALMVIFMVLRPAAKSISLTNISGGGPMGLPSAGAAADGLPDGAAAAAGLPGGAAAGHLGEPVNDGQISENTRDRIIAADLPEGMKIQQELNAAARENVPQTTGILRQWLDQGGARRADR